MRVRLGAAALLLGMAAAALAADEAVHVHRVQPGDTLIGIGRTLLADPEAWPELARVNAVRQPRRLQPGSELLVPLRLMRTEPLDATLVSVQGGVATSAGPARAGQALPEGSRIEAPPGAQATVRLVDGTLLRLRGGSRLQVDESRRVIGTDAVQSGVRLEQGRAEVEAARARAGRPGFRVRTPQGTLAVRGTAYRADVAEQGTRTEVTEGQVSAAGAAETQLVGAGQGTRIDPSGRVDAPRALPPQPDLGGLPALHERPVVRLALPLPAGVAGWRVQVGRDEAFDGLWFDQLVRGNEVRIATLPDGRHPLRVRAVDADGFEGLDARGVVVLKARPEPPLPIGPAPGARLHGTSAELRWTASSEAARYRLQLARIDGPDAGAGSLVHDLRDLDGTSRTFDGLQPGQYRWRLASVRADGDTGPFGDPQAFELRALPPQPAAPAPPDVDENRVRLSWPGEDGFWYELQVARDPAFTQLLIERRLDRNSIELEPPDVGRYHVRLRLRDADGMVGPWSAPQHFDVVPCLNLGSGGCLRVDGRPMQKP